VRIGRVLAVFAADTVRGVVMSAWSALNELGPYRITEIPRHAGPGTGRLPPDEPADPGRTQRYAALTAAYHAGAEAKEDGPGSDGPGSDGTGSDGTGSDGTGSDGRGSDGRGALAVGWVRHGAGQPVQVLAAGTALVGGEDGEDVYLTLPGGARAEPLARGALAGLMARLPCWRAIAGISDGLLLDGLLADGGPRGSGRTPPTLEECLLAVWPGPFGWLLVAEPLTAAQTGEVADELARLGRSAADDQDRLPERAAAARRLSLRHAEARAGLSAGWWRIRLLAGGTDAESASRVAGLVCASADLAGLPYAVVPAGDPGGAAGRGLQEILDDQAPAPAGGDAVAAYPFYGSTGLLAALTRPPGSELPGIRLALRPEFDVTQEPAGLAGAAGAGPGRAALAVGDILDRNRRPAGPLALPLAALNRHVLVSGAAGSGKSQTVRAMLEAATGAGIPWLVIDPSRAEYRLMAARLSGTATVVRIRPGESDSIVAGLNPLEPAPDGDGRRFPLQAHADLVKALFLACFRSEEPFSQVLGAALTRVYEDAGWDLALGETVAADPSPGYPSFADLHRAAIRVVHETGYSERVADEVLGFVRVRLSSLRLGTCGRFLEGAHQLDFGRLLASNAVIEIEDVDDDGDKAFLTGTVLIRLAEHLRMAHRPGSAGPEVPGLRHLTVIEEAHRLLRRQDAAATAGPAVRAVETFAGLLAGLRAYGEGVIVTERVPERLLGDVLRNTAVKIVHRLPAAEDREALGATMNMTPAQNRFLVTLRPGEAAVFTEGMDFPLLARMPDGTAREAAVLAAGPAAEVAGDGAPGSPAGVVQPRSVTCGTECAARPCTLRDVRVAQRALEEYPAIRLWAELSVLAHLTGWPMPVPRTTLLSLLQVMPSRLRDCAISHGVDAAVGVRVPVIAPRVSPVGLASHVSTAIRARIARGSWLCQREEPKWLAPAYAWTLVLDALKAADRKKPGAGPHPRSAEWERTYGQAITGDTCARQVGTVQRWYDAAQRDGWEVRAVAFGVDLFSGVERAVGARAEDDDFEERLSGYLDQFVDCQWPRLYLAPDPLGQPPERQ
jgi:DNA helicase HerA-like ATPase